MKIFLPNITAQSNCMKRQQQRILLDTDNYGGLNMFWHKKASLTSRQRLSCNHLDEESEKDQKIHGERWPREAKPVWLEELGGSCTSGDTWHKKNNDELMYIYWTQQGYSNYAGWFT